MRSKSQPVVVVDGGCSMLPGLIERLSGELRAMCRGASIPDPEVHAPANRLHLAWEGAAAAVRSGSVDKLFVSRASFAYRGLAAWK